LIVNIDIFLYNNHNYKEKEHDYEEHHMGKAEIADIKTKEQVLAYFKEHLLSIFQPDITDEEKNNILKKVTLEEIRYLYKIIFGIPLADKYKKIDAVYKIKDFFDSEERTADLTKTFNSSPMY
jgi:hypothetical protein